MGCGKPAEPVAEVSVETARLTLGYPELVSFSVTWRPERRLEAANAADAAPWIFVHLLTQEGQVLRTFDRPYPGEWLRGESQTFDLELYQSALGPPLPEGVYRLTLGLYQPRGGRWPLRVAAPEVGAQEYEVATVVVPAPQGDEPRFRLPEPWSPPIPGGDRQILGRRWLTGQGEILIDGLGSPGVVRLLLLVPSEEETGGHLVVSEDADLPAVRVVATCSGSESLVTGIGTHAVDVPVEPLPDGSPCALSIQPNFDLVLPETLERRSARLELLAWRRDQSAS